MKRWQWIRSDVLFALHDKQIEEHGGADGVLDLGRIEAALTRPQNLAHYGSPDAAVLAACYGFGFAQHHGFVDGNKRTAWIAARLFLHLNQYEFHFAPNEAIITVLMLAAGQISEIEFSSWIRERIQNKKRGS